MMVMTTSSPGPSTVGPRVFARRFSASEAFLVKMTSSLSLAPRKVASLPRASSMAAVASTESL